MTIQPPSYKRIRPLAAYIDRIGATEANFRRFVVRQYTGHYYREVCVIKVSDEGEIAASDAAYEPTPAEREAIRVAYTDIELPQHMPVREAGVQDLMAMLRERHRAEAASPDGEPNFYQFIEQRTGNVLMVQQRIETRDGKRYVPWSYWNDGEWRAMEPSVLPFWKPTRATNLTKGMLHEGAKAAAMVTAMCADETCTHPWIDEMRKYEHWGMIGGAYSPHRSDWPELHERNYEMVVYVCDNDEPGRAAAPLVSKHYKRSMQRLNFDASWPLHFDLADEWPKGIKKRLQDCLRASTWATEAFAVPGTKRIAHRISQHFANEWLSSTRPDVYVHNDLPRELLDADQFNKWAAPYSDVADTAKLLRKKEECLAAGLRYDPSSKSGKAVGSFNANFVNTFMPAETKPIKGDGDITPFLDYLAHCFPNAGDRTEVIRWCATLVCRPSIKMKYGMLLISETQGVGKSTLGEKVLQPLVGEWNYSQPEAKTVCESAFNGWCAHKRLVVIHEVHEDYNSKGYERLKSTITEASFDVNEKYQKPYRIENWAHVIACSNHMRALKLGMEDRRWLVPKVREQKRSPEEWRAFHAWLNDGGLQKVMWYFEHWLESNEPVRSGDEAPSTAAKRDVVREGYSKGEEIVAAELERLNDPEREDRRPIIVFDVDLQKQISRQLYQGQPNDKLEKPATIRKVATAVGWYVIDKPIQMRQRTDPITAPDVDWYRAGKTRALTNDPTLVSEQPTALHARVKARQVLFPEF